MKDPILVLDDQQGIRMLIKEALELEGYQVETAQNVKDFLDRIDSKAYSLLIMDLMMPEKNGLDLLKDVKRSSSLSRVMVISGFCCKDTKKYLMAMGVSYCLDKPFDIEELKNIVQQNMEQITV